MVLGDVLRNRELVGLGPEDVSFLVYSSIKLLSKHHLDVSSISSHPQSS